MSDDKPSDVLGALPRTRPHRRSAKRAAAAAPRAAAQPTQPKPTPASKRPPTARTAPPPKRKPAARAHAREPGSEPIRQPAQPAGTPAQPRATRVPVPPSGSEILGTAVHAAAELAEIGLTAGARAIRNALSRLPRP